MSILRVDAIQGSGGTGPITVSTGSSIVGTDTGSVYSSGSIIQMKFAKSGPARQDISSGTPVLITGLSVSITPKSASSILYIHAQLTTNAAHVSSFGVFKDGSKTVSTTGYTNSNEDGMQTTIYTGSDTTDYLYSIPVIHYETAGSTTARTYAIYGTASWSGGNRTLMINNRNGNDMASFSHMTVMEIAP